MLPLCARHAEITPRFREIRLQLERLLKLRDRGVDLFLRSKRDPEVVVRGGGLRQRPDRLAEMADCLRELVALQQKAA